MIIGQADPGFDARDATRAPLRDPKTLAETDANPAAGRLPVVPHRAARPDDRLREAGRLRPRRLALLPHRQAAPGLGRAGRLENFTRVETFGDNAANGINDVHWVKALVDPQSRDVFAFQAQIVPANRVAVPSP